jgi:hypothetical protein
MSMAKKCVFALGLAVLCGKALAGPIVVEINGVLQSTTYNDGDAITINLPPVTAPVLVRVYDQTLGANGLPDERVGSITISGGQPSGSGRLDFLISGETSFPLDSADRMGSLGLGGFGTATSSGLTITNSDLRLRTRVAIAVLGDIRGDITAGQIFRLQSGLVGSSGDVPSIVSANVTAIAPDTDWFNLGPAFKQKSIEEVNVYGLVTGDIAALNTINYNVNNDSTYANIGRVIVRGTSAFNTLFPAFDIIGQNVRRTAIVGDIEAINGRITEVLTVGSIGAVDDVSTPGEQGYLPQIRAADGIARRVAQVDFAKQQTAAFHPCHML